jgi:hypothetical protein
MLYVIEIEGPSGHRAKKVYRAHSMRDAIQQADADLEEFPDFVIVDVEPQESVGDDEWTGAAML